jgi:hypothetical protein
MRKQVFFTQPQAASASTFDRPTTNRQGERGASMVEFAVGIPVLFLLVVFLTDFAHLFLLRSTLLAGVQQGLQTAQALPGLEIDTAELSRATNSADQAKFNQYLAARQTVLARATELPLKLFFYPPGSPSSAASLVGAESQSVTLTGATEPALSGAALILPSDVATFYFAKGKIAFEHPSICGDVSNPEERENMRKNPDVMKTYCRGKVEQIKTALGSYQRVMTDFPIIVRACGRKRLFFLGEREFCESATGFHQALARSAVEEASELAATAKPPTAAAPPQSCAATSVICGRALVPVAGSNSCCSGFTQFNCSAVTPGVPLLPKTTPLGPGQYPRCCNGAATGWINDGERSTQNVTIPGCGLIECTFEYKNSYCL